MGTLTQKKGSYPMRNTILSLENALRREGLLCTSCGADIPLRALSNHSGKTCPGDLFICKGFDFKEEYLTEAAHRGAVAYMAQRAVADCGLPCILVSDVRKAQAVAARWYYDRPSEGLMLCGVTGTKGKTTAVHDLHAVLRGGSGKAAGMLCGIACDVGGEPEELHITTPESLEVQRLLRKAADHGRTQVAVEVSSQAMKLDRLYGEHFAFGLFLSLGAVHISPTNTRTWTTICAASASSCAAAARPSFAAPRSVSRTSTGRPGRVPGASSPWGPSGPTAT